MFLSEKGAPMDRWFLIAFGGDERHGYIAGSRLPPSDPAYSTLVDVGFNHQTDVWQDALAHYHTESEEYYLVIQGSLALEVRGQTVFVPAGHLLGVKAGTSHRVVGGQGPIESFSIRMPGNKDDKVVVQQSQLCPNDSWFLLDLHAPHSDYQAGACLPTTNPAYSPLWDFWSGWQRSLITWQGQEFHYHTRAEEYYIVLQGRLDLEVDNQVVSVQPGYLLGVRPGAVHSVVGGREPIDTFFFRAPGGRGDKTVIGPRRFLIE
jgi:mannose-6-phosphate isomerase-like protein (cupin superfamily)